MDGALYHGRVCSVGGCLDSQRRPILDNRPVALLQGTGHVPSASRSDYKDRRCHALGVPRAGRGTVDAGGRPGHTSSRKGSDERGGEMRIGVGAAPGGWPA